MIEQVEPSEWSVSCDECAAGEEYVDAEDFYEVVRHIKAVGWHIVKDLYGWNHVCPDCIDSLQQ